MSAEHDDDQDETGEGGPKYEPPKKVDLADLVNQDEGDESLRKVRPARPLGAAKKKSERKKNAKKKMFFFCSFFWLALSTRRRCWARRRAATSCRRKTTRDAW